MDKERYRGAGLEEILAVVEELVQKADAILFAAEGLAHEIRDALGAKVDVAALAEQALEDERDQPAAEETKAAGAAAPEGQARGDDDKGLSDVEKSAAEAEARKRKLCGWDKKEQPELEIW